MSYFLKENQKKIDNRIRIPYKNKKTGRSVFICILKMKKDKAAKRISQIIEATFSCIAKEGYGNVTMNSIAKYSKLSKGAINHYFKKKEDILIAVLNELDRKIFQLVDEKVRNSVNYEDHIKYRITEPFENITNDPTLFYVLVDFMSMSNTNANYKERVKYFLKKYRYLSSVGVRSGLEAGAYRNIDPEIIGTIMVSIYLGFGIQWILDKENINFKELTKTWLDMLIKYLEDKTRTI